MLNPTAPGAKNLRGPPKFPKRQDAPIAAFISNCSPLNERTQVLEELSQRMNVHSYGHCMHNMDEPLSTPNITRKEAKISIAENYYFIFTPENTNEYSYVTEKVYEGFESGALPVYLGAPDINRFIPDPSAIINVNDFDSTDELANYLLRLMNDHDAYMQHFEWKKKDFSSDFKRVLRLATRTVECRLAMHLAGLDFEEDQRHLDVFPLRSGNVISTFR